MKTKADLLDYLKSLAIDVEVFEHEPLYTVEQSQAVIARIPAAWCKNLFLKDSKGNLWLITALATTSIQLKKLSKFIGAPELRFASPELLQQYLGLLPGAVTTFGAINDTQHKVTVILDKNIFKHEKISIHPLENTASVTVSPHDVQKFLDAVGSKSMVVDFEKLATEVL